jgi:hypothetical protein
MEKSEKQILYHHLVSKIYRKKIGFYENGGPASGKDSP